MTLLFIASMILLGGGLAAMNAVSILLGLAGVVYSVHKIDSRQQAANREHLRRLDAERMAQGNGHPRGNVDLIVRSRND